MEQYVTFETARLLKDKGFDERCFHLYTKEGEHHYCGLSKLNELSNSQLKGDWVENRYECTCPTHQVAMRWLREVHGLYIGIKPDFPSKYEYKMYWAWVVEELHDNCVVLKQHQCYVDSYENAVEEAIKYCLEHLI